MASACEHGRICHLSRAALLTICIDGSDVDVGGPVQEDDELLSARMRQGGTSTAPPQVSYCRTHPDVA